MMLVWIMSDVSDPFKESMIYSSKFSTLLELQLLLFLFYYVGHSP